MTRAASASAATAWCCRRAASLVHHATPALTGCTARRRTSRTATTPGDGGATDTAAIAAAHEGGSAAPAATTAPTTSHHLRVDSHGLGPRRFYEHAHFTRVADDSHRYVVQVDGKTVVTPAGKHLVVPCEQLAFGVAFEWETQVRRLRPTAMPLTALASATLDLMPAQRRETINAVLDYLATDTVCFRAAEPESLRGVQEVTWDPLLDFARARYGVRLEATRGVAGVEPASADTLARMRRHLERADDWTLTAVHSAAATSKSCVIAMALCDGALDSERALRTARCDEEWQERVWGGVEGEHDLHRADAAVRLGAASVLCQIVRQRPRAFAATRAVASGDDGSGDGGSAC